MAVSNIPPPSVTLSLETQIRAQEHAIMSDPATTRTQLRALLATARERGDRANEAYALCLLGGCAFYQGQNAEVEVLNREALPITRALKLKHLESRCLSALGLAAARLGRPDEALQHFASSLDIARELGEPFGAGRALVNMAAVYSELGDYERALALYRQGSEVSRQGGGLAYDLDGQRGAIQELCHLNRGEEAQALLPAALQLAEEYDLKRLIATLRLVEGRLHLTGGSHAEAADAARAGLRAATAARDTESLAALRGLLGEAQVHLGQHAEAYRELSRSERLARSIRHLGLESRAKRSLSALFEAQGEVDLALSHLKAYLSLEETLRDQGAARRALVFAAQVRTDFPLPGSAAGDADGPTP